MEKILDSLSAFAVATRPRGFEPGAQFARKLAEHVRSHPAVVSAAAAAAGGAEAPPAVPMLAVPAPLKEHIVRIRRVVRTADSGQRTPTSPLPPTNPPLHAAASLLRHSGTQHSSH